LQSIKDYIIATGNTNVLDEKINNKFGTMGLLVDHILTEHSSVIKFRELNAGPKIDS